ncbi:hypothetical protein [Psychrobacter sp. M13]|uniref:hypothetical protein n=1 Tax=Psychrobacter sp. M13 TaxID=3067275 RepID=UPI001918892E|nr:hypothetical protein [Psychrobacter sp. M13]WLP94666.1 hypothetical protein Q9G97_00640 [Psychrobacter sp. M13]
MIVKATRLPIAMLTSTLLKAALLTGALLLSACQQQSAPEVDQDSQVSEPLDIEETKKAVQSDSAKARIEQFEPLYVVEMQRLQQRLQTEYEAFESADVADSEDSLLTTPTTLDSALATTLPNSQSAIDEPAIPLAPDADITEDDIEADTAINTSTEVGERDVEVLKRMSIEPQKPKVLTQQQTIKRYQQAMKALYQPVSSELSAENIDTLINISTLIPELFEHEEIAKRVNIKSPALARLIVRYQVAQQIEAQQLLDMQQMRETQQQEFEGLMTKFNETIAGYDEQIAKYEQTLKEFQ